MNHLLLVFVTQQNKVLTKAFIFQSRKLRVREFKCLKPVSKLGNDNQDSNPGLLFSTRKLWFSLTGTGLTRLENLPSS